MKLSRLSLTLILSVAFGILTGCDKPVEFKVGQVAELAEDARVKCWITNKMTGKRELRRVKAKAGWAVGRPHKEY
jgi:hypothetical protein